MLETPDAIDIRAAYEAAARNDVEPLVALFGPDLDWRGVEHGFLWWRKSPG
jgi:hypothetical protein